jgi:NAD(P)H-dependent flavin oxidoreductase YrpB (nitropropane dioxygenase family)
MALVTINGREHFLDASEVTITKVSNGRWSVAYDGGNEFLVIGGRESGGHAWEWFCHHPKFYGDRWLPTRSMVAAIKLGVAY